jgi:hypothetical protein
VDHADVVGGLTGVTFHAQAGTPTLYGADHVVQNNRIVDSSVWTADQVADPGIPWNFIKSLITNADGTKYPTRRIGGKSESTGVWSSGGAHRVVVRDNTIDGPFNGVSNYNTGFSDRYTGQDMDVYDNLIKHVSDDALEPGGAIINFRAWNNRIEDTSVVLSTDPSKYGPIYLFRNQGWRLGPQTVPFDAQGHPSYPASPMFKYDGGSTVRARVYVLHNTFWTDPSVTTAQVLGGAPYGHTSGPAAEAFYLRNNIFRATRNAWIVKVASMWDEDYNSFSTSDKARGLEYLGKDYTTNVAAYRTASGQGAHTNLSGDFITAPALSSPKTGDLSLPLGSPLIDAGVEVPNLSDRAGVDFLGTAPDLGAIER